jgi:hypothetical protein
MQLLQGFIITQVGSDYCSPVLEFWVGPNSTLQNWLVSWGLPPRIDISSGQLSSNMGLLTSCFPTFKMISTKTSPNDGWYCLCLMHHFLLVWSSIPFDLDGKYKSLMLKVWINLNHSELMPKDVCLI